MFNVIFMVNINYDGWMDQQQKLLIQLCLTQVTDKKDTHWFISQIAVGKKTVASPLTPGGPAGYAHGNEAHLQPTLLKFISLT